MSDTRPPPKPDPSPPAKAPPPVPAPSSDVVVLGPPTADGAGVHVLRARDEKLEAGELRTLKEGKPVVGEIVTLAPRKDDPRVCDVKDSWRPPPGTMMTSSSGATPKKGPAQVANDAYRDNWDEIFGTKKPDPQLN